MNRMSVNNLSPQMNVEIIPKMRQYFSTILLLRGEGLPSTARFSKTLESGGIIFNV